MKEKTLDVFYKGKQVGTLVETEKRLIGFAYSEDWLKTGFGISPFSLPLESRLFIPEEKSRDRFQGLFGVFADSLPDAWGQLLLDRYLEAQGIGRSEIATLDRLAYIGTSGMGALEYYPTRTADYAVHGLNYDEIASECEKILSSKPSDKLDELYALGGSSGGTRPKILISEAGKEWIVKFPASHDPKNSGRMEYDYSICAKRAGIIMTETALVPSGICEGYFKTERFDRQGNDKILSTTFAGILEADYRAPSCDYATYMRMVQVLTREDRKQLEQMFRIMCFNVYSHNLDDHTKNFAFLRKEDRWVLAPAYDLTYSNTYFGEHTTSINGKWINITDQDLLAVGEQSHLTAKRCRDLLGEVKENVSAIEKYIDRPSHTRTGKIAIRKKMQDLMGKE